MLLLDRSESRREQLRELQPLKADRSSAQAFNWRSRSPAAKQRLLRDILIMIIIIILVPQPVASRPLDGFGLSSNCWTLAEFTALLLGKLWPREMTQTLCSPWKSANIHLDWFATKLKHKQPAHAWKPTFIGPMIN